jgi:hypothetical protein
VSRVARAPQTRWRQQVRCQSAEQADPGQIGTVAAKNLRKGAVYFNVRAGEFMGIPINIFHLVYGLLKLSL